VLLASIVSCFAIAMACAARKRGVELPDLQVTAAATYGGLRFSKVAISLTSTVAQPTMEALIPDAQRVCYVTNTLREPPEITVSIT
jgi:putative redox protein